MRCPQKRTCICYPEPTLPFCDLLFLHPKLTNGQTTPSLPFQTTHHCQDEGKEQFVAQNPPMALLFTILIKAITHSIYLIFQSPWLSIPITHASSYPIFVFHRRNGCKVIYHKAGHTLFPQKHAPLLRYWKSHISQYQGVSTFLVMFQNVPQATDNLLTEQDPASHLAM